MSSSSAGRRWERLVARLPSSLTVKVPRNHREADERFARRRRVVAAFSVAGACLLGLSLANRPGSRMFYIGTFAVADENGAPGSRRTT